MLILRIYKIRAVFFFKWLKFLLKVIFYGKINKVCLLINKKFFKQKILKEIVT